MSRLKAFTALQLVLTPLLCGLVAPLCAAADESSRFKRPEEVRGSQHAGSVRLEQSFGGLYAYSDPSAPRPDRAPISHLVVGPRPMAQFTLLSAEEEAAMWALRERQRAAVASGTASFSAGGRSRHRHRNGHAANEACAPRVVESDESTCVPDLAHSDAPDWREHLVCWVKRRSTVEVQPEVRHD
jgi:hypothetical protein